MRRVRWVAVAGLCIGALALALGAQAPGAGGQEQLGGGVDRHEVPAGG
jgi:hypothetical protein